MLQIYLGNRQNVDLFHFQKGLSQRSRFSKIQNKKHTFHCDKNLLIHYIKCKKNKTYIRCAWLKINHNNSGVKKICSGQFFMISKISGKQKKNPQKTFLIHM